MKKNFVVATPTEQEYDALMQWAEKEGYKWGLNEKATANTAGFTYGKDTLICLHSEGNMTYGTDYGYNESDGPIVPFSTFAAIQGIELGPAPVTVKLTSSYKATVHYYQQVVKVGCQKVSFAKVQEIAAIIERQVPRNVQAGGPFTMRNAIHAALPTEKYSGNRAAYIAEELSRQGWNLVRA